MDEYIDRKQALDFVESSGMWGWSKEQLYDEMQSLPSADVAPVVHGKWVLGDHHVRCSVCNTRALINYDETDYFNELSPYCPWCGAKMEGGKHV